jgi:hypothetical protein
MWWEATWGGLINRMENQAVKTANLTKFNAVVHNGCTKRKTVYDVVAVNR